MELIKRLFGAHQATPRNAKENEACWCGSGKKYKDCHLEKGWKHTSIAWGKTCGRNG